MIITTPETADTVVRGRGDLQWFPDGWTIVQVRETKFPPLHADAFRRGDMWYVVTGRYPLTTTGWEVPDG